MLAVHFRLTEFPHQEDNQTSLATEKHSNGMLPYRSLLFSGDFSECQLADFK